MNVFDQRSAAAPRVLVPDGVREVLCAVVDGWTPEPLSLGIVEKMWHGDSDVSDLSPSVSVEGGRLVAALRAPEASQRLDALDPLDVGSKIHGVLAGGATFRVENVERVTRRRPSLSIDADEWMVLGEEAPSIWLGSVEGLGEVHSSGNLVVERVNPGGPRLGRKCHFRLSGAYIYYLVQRADGSAWKILIDTNGAGPPDREKLGCDFLAIQFALGRHLRLPGIVGLDATRRVVAHISGVAVRPGTAGGSFPPVPLGRNNDNWIDDSWVAAFFDRISATWRDRPALKLSLWMALEFYLDAMRNHLDMDYMRLQVGLEGLAYSLRSVEEERTDVKDKSAWKKWVAANGDAIRSHALGGREEALYQKVILTHRLSSGNVVAAAFAENNVNLTPEMVKEIEGRNVVVHQGVMSPDGYELERDVRRVAMVRTMLVALIAKAVGYGGAINGWEIGNAGYPIEPIEWWAVSDADRESARSTFLAEESTDE